MKLNVVKDYMTKNRCYNGTKIEPCGMLLHSLGFPYESASGMRDRWNNSTVTKSVLAFIQADGTVIETLPDNRREWHSGKGTKSKSANTLGYLGCEMCEPKTIKYTGGANWVETADGTHTKEHVLGTYKTAVMYYAKKCKELGFNPLGKNKYGYPYILSHSEAHKLGIASGHADVEHIWKKFNLTMDMFRQSVYDEMHKEEKPEEVSVPDGECTVVTTRDITFRSYACNPFKVKITKTTLYVRDVPSLEKGKAVTQVKEEDVYTIVETNSTGKWGLLKSYVTDRNGWIPLSVEYVEKL